MAALLPADTLVHLAVSGEPCAGRARQLAIAQMLHEEEVQRFLTPVWRQVERLLQRADRGLQRSAGIALDDLLSLGDARLSLALLGLVQQRLICFDLPRLFRTAIDHAD